MRGLVVAAIAVVLIWYGARAILQTLDRAHGEPGVLSGRAVSPSPFPVTFREQYLCRTSGEWRMMPGPEVNGFVTVEEDGLPRQIPVESCSGPYIDSRSLCAALAREGEKRVRLIEGRVYFCE